MRKKILLAVTACMIATSMAGCGKQEAAVNGNSAKQAVSEAQKVETNGNDTAKTRNDEKTVEVDDDIFDDLDTDIDFDDDYDDYDDFDDYEEDKNNKNNKNDNTVNTKELVEGEYAGFENLNDVFYEVTGNMYEVSRDDCTAIYARLDANSEAVETVSVTVLRDLPEGVTAEDMKAAYEKKIEEAYGYDYISTTYFGTDYDFAEYDYLDGNDLDSMIDVKTYFFCDGVEDYGTVIYIEHAVEHGESFSNIANKLIDSIIIDYLD